MCSCGMCTSCFDPYCRWNRWLWKTLMASCPPMSTARCLSTPSWQPLQWWSFSFGPCYVFDGGRSCSTSTWPSAACASSPSLKVWRGSCTFSAGMKEVWRVRPCFLDDDLWFSHFYNKNLRHVKFTDLCFAGVFDRFIHQLAPRFSVSIFLSVSRNTLSYMLILSACLGWGVTKPLLDGGTICRMVSLSTVYICLNVVREVGYVDGCLSNRNRTTCSFGRLWYWPCSPSFILDPCHDCTKNGWTSVQ